MKILIIADIHGNLDALDAGAVKPAMTLESRGCVED
jgi:hypothetical protein